MRKELKRERNGIRSLIYFFIMRRMDRAMERITSFVIIAIVRSKERMTPTEAIRRPVSDVIHATSRDEL